MMVGVADMRPSLGGLDLLPTSLDDGERQVAEALAGLDDGWTVYVKPRLGLDVTDFVAAHERHGVCVIAVRDWPRGDYRQLDDGLLEHRREGEWYPSPDRPRYQIGRAAGALYDAHFALPDDPADAAEAVRAAVILPRYSTDDARSLLRRAQAARQEERVEVWGGDALRSIEDVVRARAGTAPPPPDARSLQRLRGGLVEAQIDIDLGPGTAMSSGVREIATNPRDVAVRRLRGPAGSGKTLALAARAAALAGHGRSVLALTHNPVAVHHLRALVTAQCREQAAHPTLVACTSFHSFCARVADDARSAGIRFDARPGVEWTDAPVLAAEHAFERGFRPRYDAVLVDEGQDFTLEWWDLLRHHVCAPGGEMLLACDPTMATTDHWESVSEGRLLDAGFPAVWTELEGSYRMPADMVPIVDELASRYLVGERLTVAVGRDRLGAGRPGRTVRRWHDGLAHNELGRAIGAEVLRLLDEHEDLRPSDIVFVCERHDQGLAATDLITSAGVEVHHLFSEDPREQPRRRRRFWPDAPAVKGCTARAFTGWSSRAVVVGVGSEPDADRLAYVALTRVAAPADGGAAYATVCNTAARLRPLSQVFERRLA
jgi:hypothetical protein